MKKLVAFLISIVVAKVALATDHPKSREEAQALVASLKISAGPDRHLATGLPRSMYLTVAVT
jgi:hypothetical protein